MRLSNSGWNTSMVQGAVFSHLPFIKACWITTDNKKELEDFLKRKGSAIAYDKEHNPVFFAESDWMLKLARDNFSFNTFS